MDSSDPLAPVVPNDGTPTQEDVVNALVDFSGNVTDFGLSTKYIPADDDGAAIYTDYIVNNRFEKDRGIYMNGVTSPLPFQGASVAFVQLHAPTLLWICDWTACRFNASPLIPNSINSDTDWVLLDEHYEPSMIVTAVDGTTPLYRISGTYVYGKQNPNSTTVNDIQYARPPWLEDAFTRIVPATSLTNGLVDGGATGETKAASPGNPGSILNNFGITGG